MNGLRTFLQRLRALFTRRTLDRELDEEISAHLEMQAEEFERQGMSREEASYAALRKFGGVAQVKETYRGRRGLPALETTLQDLRYGARSLRKSPGFTLVAVATLALGIGANTAIFSVVNSVLLNPLPFYKSEELVSLRETNQYSPRSVVAPGNFFDWRAQNRSFSEMAAYKPDYFNLSSANAVPERYAGGVVTYDFFSVLKATPLRGTSFLPEQMTPGKDDVTIISYDLWQQRFGGDPSIVGRAINIDGAPCTVVGIMPQGFRFPDQSQLWVPLALEPDEMERRDFKMFKVVGRLKDGVTLENARADLEVIAARLQQLYPENNKNVGVRLVPMLEDEGNGKYRVSELRPTLLVLLGAVLCVLLIACVNVANLLIVRASTRQREMAVRAALGASRSRLIVQLITEGMLISVVSGLAGLLAAYAMLRGLLALAPGEIPRLNEVALDDRALGFALALSLLTGLVFGLAPVWQVYRIDLNGTLKQVTRGSTAARGLFRNGLVVLELAVALVLLVGAGLLLRSFYLLKSVDAGFRAEHVMTMRVDLPATKYQQPAQRVAFSRDVLRRVSTIPGVQSAAVATSIPFTTTMMFIMRIEGQPPVTPVNAPRARYFAVTPDYFKTMGMVLLRGRGFTEQDGPDKPLVAVINQALAEHYFKDEDPIGKRIEVGFHDPPEWREIIGIVADARSDALDADVPMQIYEPFLQRPAAKPLPLGPSISLVARASSADPTSIAAAMRAKVLEVDREQPVYDVNSMEQIVSTSLAPQRFTLVLLAAFAVVAVLLATVGLYGVIAYSVAQRTQEIGIRIALGAQPGDILKMVVGEGMLLAIIGLVVGLGGAVALKRVLESLLYNLSATDMTTFVVVALLLLIVALLACYIPAKRAMRVDPMVALRYE